MPFPSGGFAALDETVFVDGGNTVFADINLGDGNGSVGLVLTSGGPAVPVACGECLCDDVDAAAACVSNEPPTIPCSGGYTIPLMQSGATEFVCIKFGGAPLLASQSPATGLSPAQRTVTIIDASDERTVTFATGAYATDNSGQLLGLALRDVDTALLFAACGPYIVVVPSLNQKRQMVLEEVTAAGPGVFTASAAADPHLIGADGVKFEFAGQANGNYALFTSPVFSVNMHLAQHGPANRFITKFGILYRGTYFAIDPYSTTALRAAEIATQFARLGGGVTVTRQGFRLWLSFCGNHVISMTPMHTTPRAGNHSMNFFDFSLSVPGCHDSYGGALGHTYTCAHRANPKPWSSSLEETYRLASLDSQSGTYSAHATCEREDAFGNVQLDGGMKAYNN